MLRLGPPFSFLALLLVDAAHAHTGEGVQGHLISGFTHPLFGSDHVVAMVAVGLWGAFLGAPAIWLLPVAFPLVMAFGGALGVVGLPLPAVEAGIALSGVILGLLVAIGARAPLWAAVVIVGAFAIFHGHAHGTELPDAASPYAFAVGFVVATGLLHLAGIAFGTVADRPWGAYAVRAAGLAIAAVGTAFLTGVRVKRSRGEDNVMNRLLRDPLLHFFVLGAAVFGMFALVDNSPPPVAANVLEISEDDARRLVAEFEATWRRPPSVAELGHMIGQLVREEVYVREALALGLDRDDAVIRRRLQTKMEFLTESGAGAVEPDDATLQAHLEANADRFAKPPLVAFAQILLDDRVGLEEVELVEARLNRGIDQGEAARATLLPPIFQLSPAQVVDGTFGTGFFEALGALPVGIWAGPVETALGRHLVQVTERREGRVPLLAEIRDRVEQDWRAAFSARLREERFEALLGRYEVVRPDPTAVLAP